MEVTRQERGWAGHFICGNYCLFRRNTLLTYGNVRVVVSTVGLLPESPERGGKFIEIGVGRYYETMAFHSNPNDTRYYDADVTRHVSFESNWCIDKIDADDKANEMHEQVVREITEGLLQGKTYGD